MQPTNDQHEEVQLVNIMTYRFPVLVVPDLPPSQQSWVKRPEGKCAPQGHKSSSPASTVIENAGNPGEDRADPDADR